MLMATHCVYYHLVCLITEKSDSGGTVLRNLNLCNKIVVVTTIIWPADFTMSSLGARGKMTMFEAGNVKYTMTKKHDSEWEEKAETQRQRD